MSDHLSIYVNGIRHEVGGEKAFSSLSDFLRYDLCLTGTKVVCAEGDCGSCSVLLGRASENKIDYQAVCSCIQFLYQLDGTHIITVEGLKYDGQLNPVQEAMIRCQGAQCGFCTPGIVVAMCGAFERGEDDVKKSLVGNLCRCTGYESIVRAGIETDKKSLRPLNEMYPPGNMLHDLEKNEPVLIEAGGKKFFKPVDVESAAKFKAENPGCLIVAGGTDIGVQVNKGMRQPQTILALSGLKHLREIHQEPGLIIAGGCASIADLENITSELLPEYSKLLYYFGSPPIKAAATIGGNIANGSPIGDSMPALFVLDAEIELTGATGSRRVNINEFYTGYRQSVMRPDEFITHVYISLPDSDEIFKLYKISRRKDLDISAFTAAIWMRVENEQVQDVRIAFGGVGPTIVRLRKTERSLKEADLTRDDFAEAGKIARQEVKPISDVRGSMDYRLQLAENIMLKLWHELENGAIKCPS